LYLGPQKFSQSQNPTILCCAPQKGESPSAAGDAPPLDWSEKESDKFRQSELAVRATTFATGEVAGATQPSPAAHQAMGLKAMRISGEACDPDHRVRGEMTTRMNRMRGTVQGDDRREERFFGNRDRGNMCARAERCNRATI
jgi:hypothetical protein